MNGKYKSVQKNKYSCHIIIILYNVLTCCFKSFHPITSLHNLVTIIITSRRPIYLWKDEIFKFIFGFTWLLWEFVMIRKFPSVCVKMETLQQKSFCVLLFNQCKSAITVHRDFWRTRETEVLTAQNTQMLQESGYLRTQKHSGWPTGVNIDINWHQFNDHYRHSQDTFINDKI